jgi:hypothetical protein
MAEESALGAIIEDFDHKEMVDCIDLHHSYTKVVVG